MDPMNLVGERCVGERGGRTMVGTVIKYLVDRGLYEVHFEDGTLWLLDGEYVEHHIPKQRGRRSRAARAVDNDDADPDADVVDENSGFAAANRAALRLIRAVFCVLATRFEDQDDVTAKQLRLDALNESTDDEDALKRFMSRGGAVMLAKLLSDWPSDGSLGAEVLLAAMATASNYTSVSERATDGKLDELWRWRRGLVDRTSAESVATLATSAWQRLGACEPSADDAVAKGYNLETRPPKTPSQVMKTTKMKAAKTPSPKQAAASGRVWKSSQAPSTSSATKSRSHANHKGDGSSGERVEDGRCVRFGVSRSLDFDSDEPASVVSKRQRRWL